MKSEHLSPIKRISQPVLAPAPKRSASLAHPAAASSGQGLESKTQREMGSRFGHDFSQVRIHTDTRAAQSAQALSANAYAVGSDIVFGPGRYAPGTHDGDRLIAHELTHVVQQARSGLGGEDRLSRRGDTSEQEAETLAALVLEGQAVQVRSTPGAAIAREPSDEQNLLINGALQAAGMLPGPAGLAGKGLSLGLGALGIEEGARQMPGATAQDAGLKKFEGYAGGVATTLGTGASVIGGFDLAGALGMGVSTAAAGGAAAALGTGAAVAGAGLFGMGVGHELAEHTEVGPDTVGAVGGIDQMLTGDGKRSAMLRLDEYRQDQWDKGGVGGTAASIAAGVGEGVVGLGGAVGGLLEGGYHGLGALAEMI